jgi:hypothetical protein
MSNYLEQIVLLLNEILDASDLLKKNNIARWIKNG